MSKKKFQRKSFPQFHYNGPHYGSFPELFLRCLPLKVLVKMLLRSPECSSCCQILEFLFSDERDIVLFIIFYVRYMVGQRCSIWNVQWNRKQKTAISAISENTHTAHKMKFSIKDFFSKCDQIGCLQRICSHLMKKSLMENFIFCAVTA